MRRRLRRALQGVVARMSDPRALDEFLARRGQDRRLARLTHDVPVPVAEGLEFGARAAPTRLSRHHAVRYVDDPRDPAAAAPGAVPLDIAWTGAGSLAALCGRHDHYDFAIAAEAIHRVPNLLGWFRAVCAVLRPGGVLNLAVPDGRFTADLARPPSTLGEAVEADLLAYDRPSPRQLFGHVAGAAAVETGRIWTEDLSPAGLPRLHGPEALALAHAQAREAAASGAFVACPCWVFTPLAFLDLIEGASRLGLFPFVVSQFAATEPGEGVFYACLRRDAERDPEALLRLQLGAIAHVRAIAERQIRVARRLAAG